MIFSYYGLQILDFRDTSFNLETSFSAKYVVEVSFQIKNEVFEVYNYRNETQSYNLIKLL